MTITKKSYQANNNNNNHTYNNNNLPLHYNSFCKKNKQATKNKKNKKQIAPYCWEKYHLMIENIKNK